MKMETGKMYLIVHQSDAQGYPRVSAMRFLEESLGKLVFDARPTAGTQEMPRSWVQSIQPTAEKVPFLNRRFK